MNKSKVSPSEHQSVNDDILEGRFAKQRCGEHQQGVEPTAGRKKIVHKVRVTGETETLQFNCSLRQDSIVFLFYSIYPFSSNLLIIHLLGTRLPEFICVHQSIHALLLSIPSMNSAGKFSMSQFLIVNLFPSIPPSIPSPTAYHPLVWSMPSAIKSAGKVSSNSFRFSKG